MKYIFLFILFICSSNSIQAQDTLLMRYSENIIVKVIEVGKTEVKYKKQDNLNGPMFSILKSDLLMIKYENGTTDDFSNIKKIEVADFSALDASFQGKIDARKFYTGNKNGAIASILALIPISVMNQSSSKMFNAMIPSLVFATATSLKKPKDENLNYPNISLMENEDYANSYRKEAKKIKNRKIWKGILGGIGGIMLAGVIAIFSMN
jgi:hypothetical protein